MKKKKDNFLLYLIATLSVSGFAGFGYTFAFYLMFGNWLLYWIFWGMVFSASISAWFILLETYHRILKHEIKKTTKMCKTRRI